MSEVSLEDFVAETLLSIARGVRKAKETSKSEDIIPIALHRVGEVDTKNGDQIVNFSVAVEVSKRAAGAGKLQVGGPLISIFTGSATVEADAAKTTTASHRIEFGVPMNFSSRWKTTRNSGGDDVS